MVGFFNILSMSGTSYLAHDPCLQITLRKNLIGASVYFSSMLSTSLAQDTARELIARKVGELASSVPAGNRFIVTSRIFGYQGQLASHGFATMTIQRLSKALVGELVSKWCDSLNEAALLQPILQQLSANPRLFELALNPMLLSLIVLVQRVRGLIPEHRHLLYEECVNILVERRYAPPEVQKEYNLTLPSDEAVHLLQRIALSLHKARLREIPRDLLDGKVIPEILESMTHSRASRLSPREIVHNIEERSQLLVERGFDDRGRALMAFSHLTFQYLTSRALKDTTVSRGLATVSGELLESYFSDKEWWTETALLFAAQLAGEQQVLFMQKLFPKQ
jgi:hypothetical protein